MIIVLNIIFFLSIFLLVFMLINVGINFKYIKIFNNYKDNIEKIYEERIKKREIILLYEGNSSQKTFIEKIDEIIENSTIRMTLPFLTSEVFIFITVFFSVIITFIFSAFVVKYIVFNLIIFVASLLIPYLILKQIAKVIYNRIDEQIIGWINTVSNLSISNDDIVTIIEKANQYMKSPLKQYSEAFVFEARQGLSLEHAFKNFEDKVENRRFKQIIRNLSVCSKHDADYKKIIEKSKLILRNYFTEKERRKKDLRAGKKEILFTIGIGIGLFYIVMSFQEDFVDNLFVTTPGNIILAINIFLLLFAIFKMIMLDDINY